MFVVKGPSPMIPSYGSSEKYVTFWALFKSPTKKNSWLRLSSVHA